MGTKTTQTNTNQYTGQATAAQNTLSSTYSQMVANPYSGANYQMGLQQNQNASNQLSANSISNALQVANMSGMGSLTGGARTSLLSGLSRQASGLRQQGFFNNWNTATSNQQFGANVLGNLSSQLAGTTSTQTKSGLGTWLPQVLGAAAGAVAAPFTGGASLAAIPGALSGTAGAMSSAMSPMQSPVWNPIPDSGPLGQGAPNVGNTMPGGAFPWQVKF